MRRTKRFLRFIRHHHRLFLIASLSVFFLLSGIIALWAATLKIPDLQSFGERKVEQSTKIYDRTGEVLLYDLHQDVKRTVVPFEEMSVHIKNATVAIEDAKFYEHRGIRPMAFLRAVIVNVFSLGFTQGGSTITQQVVKNSLLTTDKTIARKLKEWVLAVKLEQVMSKEDILATYLNESPYGGAIYGVEEASQTFFGKSARDLSLPEAAYLAALPQAPTYYSPYGNHRDALEKRKNLVLGEMLENSFITESEYEEAKAAVVEFQPPSQYGIRAPHFVFFVRDYLVEKYGERELEERGLRVVTTLDADLQAKAEEIVKRHALQNQETFNAENAALTAVDPQTGQILVMVGSRDYFDEEIDGAYNVAVAAPGRQPGSAFKPFAYAEALRKGYSDETVVFDLKTQFSTACGVADLSEEYPCYSPNNYDNIFRGPVSFRDALAQSINVPAVKVLYLAGLNDALKLARSMGVSTLTNSDRYGLTLVLGGGEVTPLDMTAAYAVFANGGVRNPATGILRIEDASGETLEEFEPRPVQVLEANVAHTISDMLSDNEARTPAFGANSPLYFGGRDVAAKTGTTNDSRDAWIIGYTPNIAVGAWAGNNDNSEMVKSVAGFIVAPMWHEFMEAALAKFPEVAFPAAVPTITDADKPVLRGSWEGGDTYFIDTLSGKLATEYTPKETKKEQVTMRSVHSILHWLQRDDPRGRVPEDPREDPQYAYWEWPVQQWKAVHGYADGPASPRPVGTDHIHVPQNFPRITLTYPSGQSFSLGERIDVKFSAQGTYGVTKIEVYVDERFIGSDNIPPLTFSFTPQDAAVGEGPHTVKVVAIDSVWNRGEASASFFVVP
jgi:1A family penicillin-binding protein